MYKILLILAGFVFLSNSASSQLTLKIEITGLRNKTEKIMLQVLVEKEKVVNWQMSDIKDLKCLFTIENLKEGSCGVRFYHDKNMTQVMKTNKVGKPTEGYGFSNNVSGRFSMPPFEKWLFNLNEDKTIVLKTAY